MYDNFEDFPPIFLKVLKLSSTEYWYRSIWNLLKFSVQEAWKFSLWIPVKPQIKHLTYGGNFQWNIFSFELEVQSLLSNIYFIPSSSPSKTIKLSVICRNQSSESLSVLTSVGTAQVDIVSQLLTHPCFNKWKPPATF